MSFDDDSPEARGIRLRKVRMMAGLSTEELATRVGVTRTTISYWENAKHSGLTQKAAERMIKIFDDCDINCTKSWILHGIGDMPSFKAANKIQYNSQTTSPIESQYPNNIDKRKNEISLFTKNFDYSVVMQLQHNSMKPLYEMGDWIGGCWEPVNPKIGLPRS